MLESNYLSSIENEFSRLRGRMSLLSTLEWSQAQQWETEGVPLHIVLNAMGEGFKKFAEKQSKGEISSIRYFIPLVNKQFAEWRDSQVGKSPEYSLDVRQDNPPPILRTMPFTEETNMQNQSAAQAYSTSNEAIEILDNLATALMPDSFARRNITLPDALRSTVAALRGEILALLDDATQKNLSLDKIEGRLTELRSELEIILIVSVSDDERERLLSEIKTEYARFNLMPDIEKRALIRKIYQKFGLPELTLFAL